MHNVQKVWVVSDRKLRIGEHVAMSKDTFIRERFFQSNRLLVCGGACAR